MAPEQFAGEGASVRSDIYALGLVLYELYTGRRAFAAASLDALIDRKQHEMPVPPSQLIADMDPAVERVIAASRRQRSAGAAGVGRRGGGRAARRQPARGGAASRRNAVAGTGRRIRADARSRAADRLGAGRRW